MHKILKHEFDLLLQGIIVIFIASLLFSAVLYAIIMPHDTYYPEEETEANSIEEIISAPIEIKETIEYEVKQDIVTEEFIIDYYTLANNEYFAKMLELECGEISKEEWYLGYKQLICEYAEYLALPETVYDVFTEEEIYLIQRAVETEVYQASFESKVNVASVIFNRINDGRFGDTVKKVITNPGQFAWHRTKISDSTILAVEYAFEIGDTTGGCIAFRSDRKPEKWGKWTYSFSDDAVHHFYMEENNGQGSNETISENWK